MLYLRIIKNKKVGRMIEWVDNSEIPNLKQI